MRRFYPEIVEAYEESIKKPPKEKKTKLKKKKEDDKSDKPKRKYTKKVKQVIDSEVHNLSGSLKNLNLSSKGDLNCSKANVSVSINKLKRKLKPNTKKQKTIDSFIGKKRRKSGQKIVTSLRSSFRKLSIGHDNFNEFISSNPFADKIHSARNTSNKENLFLSLFNDTGEDIQESDLSDIIDKIVSRPADVKTAKVNNNLVKLIFDNKFSTPRKSILRKSILSQIHNNCSTPTGGSPIARKSFSFIADNSNVVNKSINSVKVNSSFFFDKLNEDRDAFEMSLEYNHKGDIINLDCDTTVDYSLPDVYL